MNHSNKRVSIKLGQKLVLVLKRLGLRKFKNIIMAGLLLLMIVVSARGDESPLPDQRKRIGAVMSAIDLLLLSQDAEPPAPTGPPPSPTSLAATALDFDTIELKWQVNSTNEIGFYVYRRSESADEEDLIATLGKGFQEYHDHGLKPETEYYYRVTAYNGEGESASTNTASATTGNVPSGIPSAPYILESWGTSSSRIILAIQHFSSPDGYRIYRGTTPHRIDIMVKQFSDLTGFWGGGIFVDSGLPPASTFYYQVTAYNSVGESLRSNVGSSRTMALGYEPPNNLVATAQSETAIHLSWVDHADMESGFIIFEGVRVPTEVGRVGANVTSFTHGNLNPGKTYEYFVKAYTSTWTSEGTNRASATTLGSATGPSNPPTNLTANTLSEDQIALSWQDNSNDETGFRVYFRCCGENFTELGTLGSNETQGVAYGLQASTEYDFYVVAYNLNGESAPSNTVSETTMAAGGGAGSYTFIVLHDSVIAYNYYNPSLANSSFPNDSAGLAVGNQLMNEYYDGAPIACRELRYATLLRFDIDATISGKQIRKAVLRLFPYSLAGDFETEYWVCPSAVDWNPLTATWNNAKNMFPGTCAQIDPPRNTEFPSEWDVTATVQSWASGSLPNNGFIVYDPKLECIPYFTPIRITNFESSEAYNSLDRRPQLYIEWE